MAIFLYAFLQFAKFIIPYRRAFKQNMKISLSDYFHAVKMNYARIMLEEGANILQVSESVGYANQSHFNLAFKNCSKLRLLNIKKTGQSITKVLKT